MLWFGTTAEATFDLVAPADLGSTTDASLVLDAAVVVLVKIMVFLVKRSVDLALLFFAKWVVLYLYRLIARYRARRVIKLVNNYTYFDLPALAPSDPVEWEINGTRPGPHINAFRSAMAAQLRLRHGIEPVNALNKKARLRTLDTIFREHHVRVADRPKHAPAIIALSFIPTNEDVEAAGWLNLSAVKRRINSCL
jgi:hypothetical protein